MASEYEPYINSLGAPLLKLESGVTSAVMIEDISTMNERRTIEMMAFDTALGSTYTLDLRSQVYEEAGLGMLLTIFAIFIFAGSTIFVNSATMHLVVTPIARLTDLLVRMAGMVGILGGSQVCVSSVPSLFMLHLCKIKTKIKNKNKMCMNFENRKWRIYLKTTMSYLSLKHFVKD